MTVENKSISEIESPMVKGRLESLQGAVLDIGKEVQQLRSQIEQKKGVVAAARIIAERITAESGRFAKMVDDGLMQHAEAKIRAEQTRFVADIVRNIERENANDMATLSGKLQGLQASCDLIERRFNDEVLKHERHSRMDADEEPLRPEPEKKGKRVSKKGK